MGIKKGQNIGHIRHLAYQIVAQLPEDAGEALLVIEYAKRVLLHPLSEGLEPVPFKVVDRREGSD